ncbi:hypothetical protein JCM6882_007190 [Rhodosporidiobolus microsporus]
MTDAKPIQPVVISFNDLVAQSESLPSRIQEAFDSKPESLGLLIVSDLPPEFPELRQQLLLLSNAFGSLPESVREKYTHPASNFSFGWSHGKEIMNGKPDLLKGSYYNNPTGDETPGLREGDEPTKNIWPQEEGVEGYEEAFKALCALMVRIGELVASACDQLVGKTASQKTVKQLVCDSHSSKARLLHYFPRDDSVFSLPPSSSVDESTPETVDDSWCGTHVDHSLLTVLCPSLYLFHPSPPASSSAAFEPLQIPAPSPSTGLFIKTRGGQVVQAKIPENCVALQTGETIQLLTSQRLAATPHFVNATASTLGRKALEAIERKKEAEPESWGKVEEGVVTRETLAVFLQPNNNEVVSSEGETFGEFTARVFKRHYADAK